MLLQTLFRLAYYTVGPKRRRPRRPKFLPKASQLFTGSFLENEFDRLLRLGRVLSSLQFGKSKPGLLVGIVDLQGSRGEIPNLVAALTTRFRNTPGTPRTCFEVESSFQSVRRD